jgi:urease subunit alpha
VPSALAAGVTTLITAGFEEPPYGMHRMLLAFEELPVNVGLQACARTAQPASSEAVLAAGAVGLKVHEDYGAYPELIDAALRAAAAHDVAVCLHTDGLNESAEIDDTLAAIAGRTVHAYHVEGSAGGHLPDNLLLVTDPAVICSSTTPSFPYARYTAAEHVGMILAVHGGDPELPDDLLAVTERVHEATMAAEGPLHDFGAISITNSDSQGVGRMAETIRRTWQLCDAMKRWRAADGARWGPDGGGGSEPAASDDNRRVLQYLAKYTVEPARVHGIGHEVGTLLPGRLADVVLWRPALFGVKPELVLKNGFEAWGALGGGNGSVERVQPVSYGPQWGATGEPVRPSAPPSSPRTALDGGIADVLGRRRRLSAVRGTRGLSAAI